MKNIEQIAKDVLDHAKKLKKKNGGQMNVNVNKQINSLTVELGKLNSNKLNAEATRDNPEDYANYFKGMKIQTVKLAARAVLLHDYLERHFDDQGQVRDKEN